MNQDISNFIPSKLKIAKVKKGIFINLSLLHCAGDIDSLKVINFPFSEKGKQDLELFIMIIDDVANLMMEHQDESSDFIAKETIQKHNVDYKKVLEVINKFATCDGGSESFAEPCEYFVEFHDGTGNVVITEVQKVERWWY